MAKNIKLAAQGVTITEDQHAQLVLHIRDRLDFGNDNRDSLLNRYDLITKALAGFIILDDDDKERELKEEKTGQPSVTDFNLAVTRMQLDELVTYLLEVLAPDEGMYKAIAPAKQEDIAKGFSRLLNEHAEDFDHYDELALGLTSALYYNLGAWEIEWVEEKGNVFKTGAGGQFDLKEEVVRSGNTVNHLDIYNLLYDRSVPIKKLAKKGEFFATVNIVRKFRLEKDEADGLIFEIDRFINSDTAPDTRYYRIHPEVHRDHSGKQGKQDWFHTLSAGLSTEEVGGGFEDVTIRMWIRPKNFGLSQSKDMEIWKFRIINGQFIVVAEWLNNAHGLLPIAATQPWPEESTSQEKSHAEYLMPLQKFISHQFNIHQRANRKALFGTTIYDQDVIDLGPSEGFSGGAIAAKFGRGDRDVRKAVSHFTDAPETNHTLTDVASSLELMQTLFPTNITNQVASLDRATKYQAAATVQGANRRHKKLAKMINHSALVPIRTMLMYNVYQFQESIDVFDEGGEIQKIDPAQFRETKMRFSISEGLKGIDKLLIIEMWNDIFQVILQSQQAIQQLDIIKILDYITSMAGDKFDIEEFRISHPLDNQSPEIKDAAMQALQIVQQAQEQGGQGNALPGGNANGSGVPA